MLIELLKTLVVLAALLGLWLGVCGGGGRGSCRECGSGCTTPCGTRRETRD